MSLSALPLEGRTAIVTGAKRGIGRSVALALADAGADVAICGRDLEDGALLAVAEEIRGLGRRSVAVQADTSKKADVERMVESVMSEFGKIDVLVNNAGIILWETNIVDLQEEDWDRIMDTNLKGNFLCAQAVAREMIAAKSGAIINITSMGATRAKRGAGPYNCSKAGARILTKVLALELAPHNVRVNAIAPGWVRTDMNKAYRANEEIEATMARRVPLGRLSEPEDVGDVAVFLASDRANYITGQEITVDGGLSEFFEKIMQPEL
jgi:NAD(P)-dependent dehydrogenase (short-subunit alcohol dehydrogenase family)